MKLYIASTFSNAAMIRDAMVHLEAEGHEIVSTWHNTEALKPVPLDSNEYVDNAIRSSLRDMSEIERCDALLLFTENCQRVPGGMWFEAGYAKARGKAVFITGPRCNIFCHLFAEWIAQ